MLNSTLSTNAVSSQGYKAKKKSWGPMSAPKSKNSEEFIFKRRKA